jgi:hypothetical protein
MSNCGINPIGYGEASASSYSYQAFPKWKYHQTQAPIIVNSIEEESALVGWNDTPCLESQTVELPSPPSPKLELAKPSGRRGRPPRLTETEKVK